MKKTFRVEGMMCQHCEQRVTKALLSMDGVSACTANAKEGIVDVEFDDQKLHADAVKEAIIDTGYDVVA